MSQLGYLVVALMAIGIAKASPVAYIEDFNNGIDFTVNDPYWLDNNRTNGFITTTTCTGAIPAGFCGDIVSGAGGSGNFLFDGTDYYNGPGDPNIPAGQNEFFISPTFSVDPNTNYTVSFFLTNANTIGECGTCLAVASVQPEIDGALLGSPVSAVGDWSSNGWQQFTYSWNSGSNTSAQLILHDYTSTPFGNDFGVADITVASPEPAGAAFCGLGLAIVVLSRRKCAERLHW